MPFTKDPPILADVAKKAVKDFDTIHSELLDELFANLPVENGHAHQAYVSAIESANIPDAPKTQSNVSQASSSASGDPKASENAKGYYTKTDTSISVQINPGLPFVETLESGGTIEKMGGRGAGIKLNSEGPGPLYGPRVSGGRVGALMWMEGGQKVFRMYRTVSAIGFVKKALARADKIAQSLGWKPK